MLIRYYAPHPSDHQQFLSLLSEIKEEWGINYQIVDLTGEGDIPVERKEKRRYERDFIPQASDLKKQTGSGIRKVLRSKSGGHYHLAGTIALVEDGRVKYFVSPFDPRKREMLDYDKDIRMGFLKMILDKGKQVLERFLMEPAQEKTEEERLVRRFVNSDTLDGEFELEVRVGKRRMKYASERAHSQDLFVEGPESGQESYYYRRVDAVCVSDEFTWILEAKKELNNQVIGQVLVSNFLFCEDFPDKNTKMGIICESGSKVLQDVCKELEIKTFVEVEGDF